MRKLFSIARRYWADVLQSFGVSMICGLCVSALAYLDNDYDLLIPAFIIGTLVIWIGSGALAMILYLIDPRRHFERRQIQEVAALIKVFE